MSKPSREEVIKAIQGVNGISIGDTADVVMALYEDKPKVKWEEEYFKRHTICQRKYPTQNYHPNDMIFEIVFKPNAINEIPDFIRSTLREFAGKIEGHIIGSDKYNDLKSEYGL